MVFASKITVLSPRDSTMRALTPTKRASAGLHITDHRAQMALAAVRDGLAHHHWLGRWRAIQVLRDTVPQNDDHAVQELVRLTADGTPEVRVAAAEALRTVAVRGDARVERVLTKLCVDEFECVRAAAVAGIEKLGSARCEKTSQLLVRMLGDPSADVRQGAVHALEKLSDVGDEAATQGLTQILVHCEESRRIKQHALLRYSVYLIYQYNSANADT